MDCGMMMQPCNHRITAQLFFGNIAESGFRISATWNTEEMVRRLGEVACAMRRLVD
jgi:hypothetical protein